jgi:predicted transposase YbfD/YdcC
LRKLFARLDADALDQALGRWMWTRTVVVGARRVIALDGKTVRGARTRPQGKAPHLIAAFDHAAGAVLGQVAVDAKSNEIPAARTLLAHLDLDGAVVSMDAMHTQTDTATTITAAGEDYLLTLKANMPTLHQQLKKLPWKHMPARQHVTTGRGQRVTRTIKVAKVPDWVDFPGATQIAQLRRTLTRHGKKTVEIVYLITSADPQDAPPDTLAAWVQGHWGIENRLHYVRDVTFREDLSQVRTGHAPRIMATLRSSAISLLRLAGWDNIAAALRHHAWHPEQAIELALTC